MWGGGPIALHGLVRFLDTTGPSLTKVVYAYFDRRDNTACCFRRSAAVLHPRTFNMLGTEGVLHPDLFWQRIETARPVFPTTTTTMVAKRCAFRRLLGLRHRNIGICRLDAKNATHLSTALSCILGQLWLLVASYQ